ncbi:MAG: pilus assembly protein TadG-related protein [Hyphomonadaceae bacterium]|jgi:Flp pilus assembly protein TadG|uniref:pilus assembly protein TadG-related protein n=1 Tax=Aquidulcibacter sp. TaxID=2052990 RepID=UPI002606D3D5|nr:pilus assembly protein TadG-related protein [Aquidulcibacter sp.]MCE2889695.1 pilus assembly protein TadG-related protein [Hyphomonadaceae bacterium]
MLLLPPLRQLKKDPLQSGNMALTAALLFVPLAMIVAMTSEFVALSSEKALMQSAADAAALSGAQNLILVGASARQSTSDVERFAMAQVGEFANRATVSFKASQGRDGTFTVEGLALRPSFFGDLVPPGGFRIEVKSIAESMQV